MPENPDRDRDEWVREQSRLREKTLAWGFGLFSSDWSASDKEVCFLNRGLLLAACESYFRDILRRKEFHGIQVADSHKCAGYIAKWLVKFRPIQYRSYYVSKKAAAANEYFSLWVATAHLSIDISEIPVPVVYHILYHLRYRTFDAEAWSLSFFLLQRCFVHGVLPVIGRPHQ